MDLLTPTYILRSTRLSPTGDSPMPRQIPLTITFDDAKDEILFTTATLKADPDAKELLPMTDGWLALRRRARQGPLCSPGPGRGRRRPRDWQ
jgi:hypothetical protein